MKLTDMERKFSDENPFDFSDLRAIYINCTLKRSPEQSNTQGLGDRSIAIMEANGVHVEQVRAVDHRIATGMTWNMLHLARMIKDAGGWPVHGNQRTAWDAGARFDYPNPEYRT